MFGKNKTPSKQVEDKDPIVDNRRFSPIGYFNQN